MENFGSRLLENIWVIEAVFFVLLFLGLNFFLKRFLSLSKHKTHLKGSDWRAHIDQAALLPARTLVWILLFGFLWDLGSRQCKLDGAFIYFGAFKNIAIVICLSWFLFRWKKVVQNAMIARRVRGKPSFDAISIEIIGKLFSIFVVFLTLLISMQILGINVAPLITFGGIGAAAIGIASKDVIANFFGGLMIYVTRPFTIHDLIEIPDKSLTGYVEEIGWYFTSLRDLAKKAVYIPNAVFSTGFVTNWSRMTHRKIDEVISLRSMDVAKVMGIVEEIRTLFERHAEIDHQQQVNVFFKSYSAYSLEILVQAYTLATRFEDFMEIQQKILLEINDIIVKRGAEMSMPLTQIEILKGG